MQIQINTDDNISGREAIAQRIETEIETVLGRFGDHITRVEVHLSDKNAGKGGADDIRCLMEARPAGLDPVAVTHDAATVEAACGGAVRKLQRLLDSSLGKLGDHKGGASIRTMEG